MLTTGFDQKREERENLDREAAKKAQQEQEEQKKKEEEAEYQKREEMVKKRQGMREAAVNGLVRQAHDNGTLAQLASIQSMNIEGVLGQFFVDFGIFACAAIWNVSYMSQVSHYVQAAMQEESDKQRLYKKGETLIYPLDKQGRPDKSQPALADPDETVILSNGYLVDLEPLIYRKDKDGKYPIVYVTDPNTGQINYKQPYPDGQAPIYAIRANGLVPTPSFFQGWQNALTAQVERTMGSDWLTPQRKLELYGYIERGGSSSPDNEEMIRKRTMAQGFRPPTPVKRSS